MGLSQKANDLRQFLLWIAPGWACSVAAMLFAMLGQSQHDHSALSQAARHADTVTHTRIAGQRAEPSPDPDTIIAFTPSADSLSSDSLAVVIADIERDVVDDQSDPE